MKWKIFECPLEGFKAIDAISRVDDYYERTRLDGSEDTGQRLQDFDDRFYENDGFTAVF